MALPCFTPEPSKRKSPRLLLVSKQLSTTREDIANDSSTDSDLSPSQLSAFTSPVPADILLDDDSKRSHQIIKKQGRPSKNQWKRNAVTAPKFMPAGCTAILAVIIGHTLTVANAGDSQAVLCRMAGGKTEALSFDRKPQQDQEMDRIHKAGRFVNQFGRVNGYLNLSRSNAW